MLYKFKLMYVITRTYIYFSISLLLLKLMVILSLCIITEPGIAYNPFDFVPGDHSSCGSTAKAGFRSSRNQISKRIVWDVLHVFGSHHPQFVDPCHCRRLDELL